MIKSIFGLLVMLCILCAGGINSVWAQAAAADSLRQVLNSRLDKETRVDVLNNLAYSLFDNDDSVAAYYAGEALSLATSSGYVKGRKYALTLVGLGYLSKGMYAQAFAEFRKSASIVHEHSESVTSYTLSLIGNGFRDLAVYDSSRYYYQKAIDVLGGSPRPGDLAALYKNIGYLDILMWRNDDALVNLRRAEEMAVQSKDDYTLLNVYSLYGMLYENLLDFSRAQEYFEKMCEQAQRQGDHYHLIRCSLNRANLAYRRGEFSESLRNCFDALAFSRSYNYPPQLARIYLQIGDLYVEFSQYDLAFKYYFLSLKITERLHLNNETAEAYSSLAWAYKDQHNFPLALEYVDRSQKLREQIGSEKGIANCHNVRGIIYYLQKRYADALREHESSLAIRKKIGHEEGVSASIYNLSLVYEDQGQIPKAIEYQSKAIAIEEKIDNKQNLAISYNSIADLYIKNKDLPRARHFLELANKLSHITRSRIVRRNVLGSFSRLSEAAGDVREALRYQKQYQLLNDSIYSEAGQVKLAEMQALYEVEQKEQKITLLNQEKLLQDDRIALQRSRINMQGIIIISAVLGLILVSVLALKSYRYNRSIKKAHHEIIEQKEEIQAQSEELIEANHTIAQINRNLELKIEERTSALKQAYKELDTFFYRSSHDFRRPLTTFLGLAEVAKVTVRDKSALELFDKVKETAMNLDKMLVKLQSISDVGGLELVYKEVFVDEMFHGVCVAFQDELTRKGIVTHAYVNLRNPFISYPAMVKIIIENLVENAINFSAPHEPHITLIASDNAGELILEVNDNGQGIDKLYHERVFDMYFRGSERSKGNGLGLYIVKKAVEKLNGSIRFESDAGKGARFIIHLPLHLTAA